jgi:hypothetical protein
MGSHFYTTLNPAPPLHTLYFGGFYGFGLENRETQPCSIFFTAR